jgi:putative membrane protein
MLELRIFRTPCGLRLQGVLDELVNNIHSGLFLNSYFLFLHSIPTALKLAYDVYMTHIALRISGIGLALLLCAYLIPGITFSSIPYAFVAALVLGLLNISVRPVLIFLTLPATILTLGLFILVINACVFLLADYLLIGFAVDGFTSAFLGSLIVSVVSSVLHRILT